MERKVVILTKSSKHGGYCVAGIDIENRSWIRLVSNCNSSHGALQDADMMYSTGEFCTPLDVVKIPLVGYKPIKFQPENALIDRSKNWEKIGRMSIEDVLKIHPAESSDYLLGNQRAYLTEDEISKTGGSLTLANVCNFTTSFSPWQKKKAYFTYNGRQYNNISITDPEYRKSPEWQRIKSAILVVSLPDSPYTIEEEDRYYKFVAKVFPLKEGSL